MSFLRHLARIASYDLIWPPLGSNARLINPAKTGVLRAAVQPPIDGNSATMVSMLSGTLVREGRIALSEKYLLDQTCARFVNGARKNIARAPRVM